MYVVKAGLHHSVQDQKAHATVTPGGTWATLQTVLATYKASKLALPCMTTFLEFVLHHCLTSLAQKVAAACSVLSPIAAMHMLPDFLWDA